MNHDILLRLAEQADLPTISTLMCLSKATYGLLTRYQHSIVMAKVRARRRNLLYPPVYAPTGRVLSRGLVLQAYTYPVIRELEVRELRIAALFSPGQPLHGPTLLHYPEFADQALPSMQKLALGLSRACMVLDRLADCAADICGAQVSGVIKTALASSTEPFPLVLRRVRRAQMAAVRSLGLAELAFLLTLTRLCGQAWAAGRADRQQSEVFPELVRANEELVLRHGTLVIHSITRPSAFASHAAGQAYIQAQAWAKARVHDVDLEYYGKDDNFVYDPTLGPILPSLRMVLWDAFRKKADARLGSGSRARSHDMNLVILEEIGAVCLPRRD